MARKPTKSGLTPAGRARLAEVGAANLRKWQERAGKLAALTAADNERAVARATALVEKALAELCGGDESKLTARQAHVLESQKLALTVLCLTQAHFNRKGLLIRRARPDPLLSVVVSFMNCARLNIEALGLTAVADPSHAVNAELATIESEIHEARRDRDS